MPIRTEQEQIVYQDNNTRFTVTILVDRTNHTREVTSLKGPGISGNVSQQDTDDFLLLMKYACENSQV